MIAKKTCSIPKCGKPVWARGLCSTHYATWQKRVATAFERARREWARLDDDR
jgi:hypothetical protein